MKILVGMSGGVDSSITAFLLKEQGYDVVGATLSLPKWDKTEARKDAATRQAKLVCEKLGIPHFVIDANASFKKNVVDYFDKEYSIGRTPNPCVICNRDVKFASLFIFASEHNIDLVATGHYAIVRKNKEGRAELLRGRDSKKDQSYYLSMLPQAYLKRLVLPLGEHTKKEVYLLAEKNEFKQFKKTPQSQDFCYLAGCTTEEYLGKTQANQPGPIIDQKGAVIGSHKGLSGYTIGQRKRIGLGGGPYYVQALDTKNNSLIVAKDKSALTAKSADLSPYNITSSESILKPMKVEAQIRYQAKPVRATVVERKKGNEQTLHVKFDKPVYALTPGQVCVLYQGEACLGGGFIN